MRLLTARVRDYRLHRDLAVEFDPRFTVIAGANQSGKSTLAEALHRALFLPAKTGGEVHKGMRSDPFRSEPEVELAFEAGGERWQLSKRFAATRGSVTLQDSAGRSLSGDEAEEKLAALIGTAAVDRTTAAGRQLKERWGHLWVWQGSASGNPLALSAQAYDHDRLVERLQAGAELGVTSELDLAVMEDIQARWSAIFTAGGANRPPQVRKGSPLQLARAASLQAQGDLEAIEALIARQREAEQAFQQATDALVRLGQELPQERQQRQALLQRLARSGEVEAQITRQQPLLDGVSKELAVLTQDRDQLKQLERRIETLTAAQAPALARLEQLRGRLPALEKELEQLQSQLQAQQRSSGEAAGEARVIEARLQRLRLLQEQGRIQGELAALEQLRAEFRELKTELATLPELDAAGVERLRRLQAAVQAAEVRTEALSAGLEVIRAGQLLLLDGEALESGGSRLLSQPTLLQVGENVELRLVPGGGTSTAEAARALERARQALAQALQELGLPTLEAAVQAERRRSELLAAQERLLAQARAKGEDARLRQRLATIDQELQALPAANEEAAGAEPGDLSDPERLQTRLDGLEHKLREARSRRDQAQAALQAQQSAQQQASQALEAQRKTIQTQEQEQRDQQTQLLDAGSRRDALLQRHGSQEQLHQTITLLGQRQEQLQTALTALRTELDALNPAGLRAEDQRLAQRISALEQQERQESEARIRAEERLHGDGQTDLQAEREQKQAELESRLQEQQRLEKEAAMLTLLRRLLEEEQNAMGSQYTAPMLSRIGRYLAHVFPEAPEVRLAYDARGGFQGLEWRRGDEAAFRFEELSTGAREQFAAALRVSMAEVLAEAYDGCLPVLFDDAFANSDPQRQRGVHRMLQQAAGQGLQVILLSCDAERCQEIGGALQLRLET
jgi:energy-coupling factor transporter ATP-binding protein EcfA2